VRRIIEPAAIKLAFYKITPEEIDKLNENVIYCEKRWRSLEDILDEKEFFELDQKITFSIESFLRAPITQF
jgi:DNA-binding FadR family transcriptional regulator